MPAALSPQMLKRGAFTALALSAGAAALQFWPAFESSALIAGSARLAGLFSGSPVLSAPGGWIVSPAGEPLVVTAACSAADFFLLCTVLLAWRIAPRARHPAAWPPALLATLACALFLTLPLNALRIIALAHVHYWSGDLLPPAYDASLHLLVGVALFLPSLIGLNLLLEHHERQQPQPGPASSATAPRHG